MTEAGILLSILFHGSGVLPHGLGWRCVSHYRVVVVLAVMHSGVACCTERDQVLL